jgi:two-component system, chemotaxis family, sensor kinase CheA
MHSPMKPPLDVGIELGQFHSLFFDEAGENLERMEQLLLALDLTAAGDEVLNAIFRCAHSVKGGAATFGLADVAELTHQMETLLDRLRRGELAPTAAMVDTLLRAGDTLRAQLSRHRAGGDDEPIDASALLLAMRGQADALATRAAGAPASSVAASAAPAGGADGMRRLELRIGPLHDTPALAALAALVEMFREIPDLGHIEALDDGGADGMRRFSLATRSSDAELMDLMCFHVSSALVQLSPGLADAAAPAPPPQADVMAAQRASPAAGDAGTLRVAVGKVDQLINLVGELVITQAMLAQRFAALEPAAQQQLAGGLGELERHTRALQDAAMSIRMIPMSVVFSRFPRLLRDLAGKLGKKVELVTQGDATELDKGLIEKITDPLTHLVRNACDHGVEAPAERAVRGKPETGTITLAAAHQGGSIVIEVRDDGRGLSRAALLKKARECGLPAPDTLGDDEVWALIFAPGFSTAAAVTEVSGRGVGMDVVKRNIGALGGVVEIESREGQGMCVRVRLPLTLAIMDSMSVRVADECYVLPLSAVVESLQCPPGRVLGHGGAELMSLRDEVLPVLALDRLFDVRRSAGDACADTIVVVVEADGMRAGLRVDELLGQQQVVVKNLETNFARVDNVSGATILGDGRVALILDIGALLRRLRR